MNPEIDLLAAVSSGKLLLSGVANPFEIDPLAFQHHPVRMVIGALCLVLAMALTIYQTTHRKAHDAKRKKNFGETVTHSTATAPAHKTKQKGERRYGEIIWTLFFPSYKGGGSKASSANLNRSTPSSYKRGANEERYGSFQFPNPFHLYKGGGSRAGSANLNRTTPESYKERWGSEKRYGSFQFINPFQFYKGGESKAKSARLNRSQPDSYRESWGSQKRYGSFQFINPFNFYKGGGSHAGEGRSHVQHRPNSHTGRVFSLRGGWEADAPSASYKGGESRAERSELGISLPLSYRSRPGARKKTYRFQADVSSYSGGGSAGEGKIPLPHVPTSHGGHRLRRSQLAGWKPFAAIQRYRGGIAVAGEALIQNLNPGGSHKRRIIPAVRYGFSPKELPAPSYKGGWAAAKPARLGRKAPQSHRFRTPLQYLGSKRWSVPVNSYKGGYGIAGVGKPVQELPLSYRHPWSFKAWYFGLKGYHILPIRMDGSPWPDFRYVGFALPPSYKESWGFRARYLGWRCYHLLPIRMDGSPWPEFRSVGPKLPLSYKEPWGFKLRYCGTKNFHILPIHMDGAPCPDFRPVVELPASYKEPWGFKLRYGRGFSWKWTIPGAGYRGGSRTNPVRPWQNPDTGALYIEHMSDRKRYGTSKYGGKLYGQRSPTYFKYHREELPDDDVEWRLVRVGGVPVDEYGNKILPPEEQAPVETVEPVAELEPMVVEMPADVPEETPPQVENENIQEPREESLPKAVEVSDLQDIPAEAETQTAEVATEQTEQGTAEPVLSKPKKRRKKRKRKK